MIATRPRRAWLALTLAAPLALAIAAPAVSRLADDYVSPGQARLKADVYYLADDAREGRGPGTKGLDASADYIAANFKEAGLKPPPGADGYFQYFDLPGQRGIAGEPTLAVTVKKDGEKPLKAALKTDFQPLALGGAGEFKDLPLVFAGYGITADDSDLKLKYDDYADLDVTGKAVLILRREPQQDKEESPFGGKENTTFATFNHKVANAVKHGAKLVLLVNDAHSTKGGKDELLEYPAAGGSGNGSMGFFMVSREFASKALKAGGGPDLDEAEAGIDADLKPRSKALEGVTVDGSVKIEMKTTKVKNVIGVIEGAGPLADETVVIGAHYDHVGMGGANSLAFGVHAIHNGADDNASGTATVMELARRLGKRTDPLPRRVVFMAFSAEELGLIGSRYYVNHPIYPLDKTVTMINFDMVGRLNKGGELTVFGAGTSPGFESLVTSLVSDQGMKTNNIVGTQGEFFQSDHASFYLKNMPVIFFFTGTHPDYHRPADDSDKINFEGMARVANVGELIALDLVRRPERPKFVKLGRTGAVAVEAGAEKPKTVTGVTGTATAAASGRGMSTAYFGSRPSYGDNNGEGVKLDGVSEGGPAEKAGLKEGDIIVKFGGKEVKDLDSYMAAMGAKKPGDTVEVVAKRDGKEKTFQVKLTARPGSAPKN
jgi:Peptidase family M28/PDZ domain/PA domain